MCITTRWTRSGLRITSWIRPILPPALSPLIIKNPTQPIKAAYSSQLRRLTRWPQLATLYSKKLQVCLLVRLTPCKPVSFWTSSRTQMVDRTNSRARSSSSRRQAINRCSSQTTGELSQRYEARPTQQPITMVVISTLPRSSSRLQTTYLTSQRYLLRTRSWTVEISHSSNRV